MRRVIFFRRGFSLVEFAIVLGVGGVILAGLWYAADNAYENMRRQQMFDQVQTVVKNIRDYYAGQAGFPQIGANSLVPLLADNNVIPSEMVRRPYNTVTCSNPAVGTAPAGICADTPWASSRFGSWAAGTFRVCDWIMGATTCTAAPLGGTTQYFALALLNIPVGSCIALATKLSSSLGPQGLAEVNINGCNILANTGCGAYVTSASLPVSGQDATWLCTNMPNPFPAALRLVYKLRTP